MAVTPKPPGTPDAPNSTTSETAGQTVAPSSLASETSGAIAVPASTTSKSVGVASAPNSTTAKSIGSVGNPASTTAKSSNDPVAPNSLSTQAVGSVAVPTSTTSESVGVVVKPASTTAKTIGSVGNPANTPAKAVGNAVAPNSLTTKTASVPSAPASLTAQTSSAIPRSLTPLLNLDFASQCYAQCGVGVEFADLFTYTRNSSATFINRRMNCGKWEYFLDTDYVGSVTNLLTYSEQLDNAAWAKGNASVSANSSNSPLSRGLTSDKIIDNAAIAVHTVTSNTATVTSGAKVNISVYLKSGTESLVGVYDVSSAVGVLFDLKNGVVDSLFSTPLEYSMTPSENGYYRCSVTTTAPGTSASLRLYSKTFSAYVGTGEFYFATGAQITESVKLLPYVQSITTSVTNSFTESARFEYDPINGESLGYLAEGSGTNLALRSEEFNNSSWVKSSATITANDIKAPDETISADKITSTSAGGTFSQALTLSTSSDYTISIYSKNIDSLQSRIELFDLTGGDVQGAVDILWTSGVPSLSSYTGNGKDFAAKELFDGWWRLSFAATSDAVNTSNRIFFYPDRNGTGKGSYYWGAQVEASPFATSYIRTEGAAVSRAGDLMLAPINFNDSIGSIYANARYDGSSSDSPGGRYITQIDDGTNDNRHLIYNGAGNHSNSFGSSSAITQWSIAGGSSSSLFVDVVETYESSAINLYADGNLVGSDTSFTLPQGINSLGVGNSLSANQIFGHIKELSIYDEALTSQEIALL